MQNKTTSTGRFVIVLVVVIAGILLLTLLPSLGMKSMDGVINGAYMKIEKSGNLALVAAPKLVKFFFPFWSGLGMVAGAALLLLAYPIYRGEKWGRPLALGMLAIPSVAGAYMLGPIMFFADKVLWISAVFMLVGLIPYFIVLLYEQNSGKQKTINFFIFTLLGVTAAYNFGNGHSSLRQLMSGLIQDPKTVDHSWALGVVVNWVGVILVLVGIPLLAGRMRAGWWLSTIGIFALFFGTGQLFLGHPSTIEFIVGTSMALVTLILLVMPSIGGTLVDLKEGEKHFIPSLEDYNQAM